MSSTKLTTDNIESLDASKLSGNLPAIDGSNLTGIGDFMVSSSDPTTSENPSGGVGTLWMNHSSGESYMLTNASTNSNVWTNIGTSGTGDIFKPPYNYWGTQSGYSLGFGSSQGGLPNSTTSAKWSFSSNNTTANHNSLVHAVGGYCATAKALDWSYIVGGNGVYMSGEKIQKMSHSTGVSSVDQGTGTANMTYRANQQESSAWRGSCCSETNGWFFGGQQYSGYPSNNQLEKYNYAYNSGSTNHGNLSNGRSGPVGMSDVPSSYGYLTGGYWYPPNMTFSAIERFSYSSSNTSTMSASISHPRHISSGYANASYGWCAGGSWPAYSSNIERLSFASNGTVTQWGNLYSGRNYHFGAFATYTTEGHNAGGVDTTAIAKFSFSSNGSVADWGTLTQRPAGYVTGQHS